MLHGLSVSGKFTDFYILQNGNIVHYRMTITKRVYSGVIIRTNTDIQTFNHAVKSCFPIAQPIRPMNMSDFLHDTYTAYVFNKRNKITRDI